MSYELRAASKSSSGFRSQLEARGSRLTPLSLLFVSLRHASTGRSADPLVEP
jgi:hypothetical protein